MYRTEILDRRGATVTLRLNPEQPDCMPYYLSRGFAASTLWYAQGAIQRDDPSFWNDDDVVECRRRGDRYVASLALVKVHNWPWLYASPDDTWADYRIELTDRKWADGLDPGRVFPNYAYDNSGPYLSAIAIGPGGLPPSNLIYAPGTPPVRASDVIEDPTVLSVLVELALQ
jgi:hypothetical protein